MSTNLTVKSGNQAVGKHGEVKFPIDREALARETGGTPDDKYKAVLSHEKHFLNCLETAVGRTFSRLKTLNPSVEQIIDQGGLDLADAVLTLHKDLHRTHGGTAIDLPLAKESVKSDLWKIAQGLLTKPLDAFKDPERYAKHIAWWKQNGSPVKVVVPIGGSTPLAAVAPSTAAAVPAKA